MKIAIYPGSFDPLTNGHMDIIERASRLTDKLIVAILRNTKKQYWLAEQDRLAMLKMSTSHLGNVEVEVFGGLLVDYARSKGARAIIRGMRMVSDFEYEMALQGINKHMAPEIETVYLMTDGKWSYLSSSLIKEAAAMGGNINDLLPPPALEIVKRIYSLTDEGEAGR